MCFACELAFWDMVESLPPEQRERIMREQAARLACDAPDDEAPLAAATPTRDENQP
jgi:hypothetical protein